MTLGTFKTCTFFTKRRYYLALLEDFIITSSETVTFIQKF